MHDLVVIGGGIVGLATARAATRAWPGASVVVVEKEPRIATHQTGRNSGVVHAGLYYSPGSLKARLCTEGRARLAAYAADRGLPYRECGKVVVAVDNSELGPLRTLYDRALANGVPDIRWLDAAGLAGVEPAVRGVAAVHSPHTAITDFAAVAAAYADDVRAAGGDVLTGFDVVAVGPGITVTARDGRRLDAAAVVTCAGLWSDRVARLTGDGPDPRVVPFRGDYFALTAPAADAIRGLVYPVPDARYPFLGIHLTRTVHGEVLVGPNAVLAGARDGRFRPRDLAETLAWPGFRRVARQHWRTGASELGRSLSRRAFARAARRYVPTIRATDLRRAAAGVRAQCIGADGSFVDDFCISRVGPVVNVRNAPSPAATASLAIADEVVAILAQ